MKKAIVLLSGGLDSAVTLAIAKRDGFTPYALSFRYGQRHVFELACADRVARTLGAQEHKYIEIDLRDFGGSALTDDIDVPKHRGESGLAGEIPVTYVPARNTIFLAYALAYAEVRGATDLFIGANAIDYSGYPDCRPAFIEAFERLANLATRTGVETGALRVHAPLLTLTKADIVRLGTSLGVDFALTSSCYDPNSAGLACGACDSCQIRRDGFLQAGISDPTRYAGRRNE